MKRLQVRGKFPASRREGFQTLPRFSFSVAMAQNNIQQHYKLL